MITLTYGTKQHSEQAKYDSAVHAAKDAAHFASLLVPEKEWRYAQFLLTDEVTLTRIEANGYFFQLEETK